MSVERKIGTIYRSFWVNPRRFNGLQGSILDFNGESFQFRTKTSLAKVSYEDGQFVSFYIGKDNWAVDLSHDDRKPYEGIITIGPHPNQQPQFVYFIGEDGNTYEFANYTDMIVAETHAF